jgi:hypothetical protein
MLPLKSFVFLFLLTFHAWSQQGVVLDHTTRQPLSGVLVTRNGVETQNTDAQGRYSFTGTLGTSALDAVQNLGLHFSSGTGRFEWQHKLYHHLSLSGKIIFCNEMSLEAPIEKRGLITPEIFSICKNRVAQQLIKMEQTPENVGFLKEI